MCGGPAYAALSAGVTLSRGWPHATFLTHAKPGQQQNAGRPAISSSAVSGDFFTLSVVPGLNRCYVSLPESVLWSESRNSYAMLILFAPYLA